MVDRACERGLALREKGWESTMTGGRGVNERDSFVFVGVAAMSKRREQRE